MSREELGPGKLAVLIDCSSSPIFSARLIPLLSNSGVKIEELLLPKREADVLKWAWKLKGSESRIVHYLWGAYLPHIYIIPKILGKKVIVHWVGSDVVYSSSRRIQKLFWRVAHGIVDLHLTVIQSLAEELKPLRIDAAVVPLVPDIPASQENIAWPADNRVLTYIREERPELYGGDTVFRLAKEMADLEFLITGHSGKGAPQLPNVKYLGFVDLEPVWQQAKVYLRLTKHDGLSNMVLEALARGRQVIWSQKFPHCYYARTFEEARDALQDILSLNEPNVEGMHYARSEFDPLKIAENIKQKYVELLALEK